MNNMSKKTNKGEAWIKLLTLSSIIIFTVYIDCIGQINPLKSVANITELETYMKSLTDHGIPQGMSFLVVKDSQIVYSKGFGWADSPDKIAASPESVYHWFSITKVVTAMAIMQLVEKGKLKLEDQVSKYLSFFKVKYPSDTSKQITILDLLNHSSGMPDAKIDLIRWVHHDGDPSVNQTQMIKRVLPKYSKLTYEPGSQTKYTSVGYMVLSSIIEKVTMQNYEDYVKQNILLPLGMVHTDFIYTPAMGMNIAAGSHPFYDLITLLMPFTIRTYVRESYKRHVWFERFYTDQAAPSGLIGPVTDVALLIMAYINKGELNGKRVLSEESINKMTYTGFTLNKEDDPNHFSKKGIAWMVERNPDHFIISHTGSGLGFNTDLQIFPEERIGFVLFSNDTKCKAWQIVDLATTLKW
jgi:CubicO group peptidase (beta-lactamase class C family)